MKKEGVKNNKGRENNLFALSIRQPWAFLIADGLKKVENRTWATAFRGVILIHAAKEHDTEWEEKAGEEARHIIKRRVALLNIARFSNSIYDYSAIIGAAIITGSDRVFSSIWCIADYNYIHIGEAIRFKNPIKCPGKQKIFRPDVDLKQFSKEDRETLNKLYDISYKTGLQVLDITVFNKREEEFISI